MADKTDKNDKTVKPDRDDDRVTKRDDEPDEIFTDLRDNSSHVEVPDDAQEALDELSEALGVKDDDDDDVVTGDKDGDDKDDEDKDDKAAADEAARLEAEEAAKGREIAARKTLVDLKTHELKLIAAQAETLDVKEVNAKTLKASAERILASYTERMTAFKEAGDTKGEIALQAEGLDARETLKSADATLALIQRDRPVLLNRLKATGWNGTGFEDTEADKAEIAKASGTTTTTQTATKPSKHSADFVKANAWMRDPKHAKDRDLLLKMDVALRSEGIHDVDDPKYFTTLVKRFNDVKPGLARDLNGKQVATGSRERNRGRGGAMPSGGLGTIADEDSDSRGKVSLTSLDLRTMRSFGMDPNSKKDRTAFLTEKRADARRQSAGRA